MQSAASNFDGEPAVGDLEQSRTALAHIREPIMIAVIEQFGTLVF
jgi:hypothetical protein